MATPGFRTCRWWHVCSSGTACSGLSRSVVTVHGLMRGLGSRLGHGAGHGAGRRRGDAPARQPGDGEAVIVRFEAGRFGQELRLGAVGVFSSRLPVGRRQACPGVLAPEDKVSFDLGGVQDEHGFVRCCVGVSVCYGAGVWQGPGAFQAQLGWTGRMSRGAGRAPGPFHSPAW